jgi:glycerol uptake facilitator-like aquaporin
MKSIFAEFFGTAFLVTAIVGSGYMASFLTDNIALQLLINAISTVLALFVAINLFSGISGAHFNPVVTLLKSFSGEMGSGTALKYMLAQCLGAISGTALANLMFEMSIVSWSEYDRLRYGTFLAEVVATLGLLLIVTIKSDKASILIPTWIGSAYFFTSSTSFANPAVTIGRIFTNSFSGLSPSAALGFIAAQFIALLFIFTLTSLRNKGVSS